MNGPSPELSSNDSRDKWITIDRLCDAYEASLQNGRVERAPFLAGVPADWRDQLSNELDAIDAAYQDSKETREESVQSSSEKESTRFYSASVAALSAPGGKNGWLGRFEVKERLGTGATGSVWRARDDRLDRWVALKVPHATRVMSETTAARFKTEARAAAAISHPNVVQVHEVLIEDGLPILIQQWIDGPSLADSLDQSGPLDCDRAVDWMMQITEAVACAHDHGIVHRDLKPANVMLNNGRPMVLDFGLASYPQFSSGLTTEGTMLGTPAYMSPEQADGKPSASEPTSDIYALGAMLYEMLVGQPPFVGKTSEVLESVKSTMPTPPRNRRSEIPRDLETIALRCLAKSPSSRYKTAADLRDDLQRFRDRKPIHARKVSLAEHAIVWCRANPVSTLLWITIPLVLLLASAFVVSRFEKHQLSDQADFLAKQHHFFKRQQLALSEQHRALLLARASQELWRGDRKRGLQMLEDFSASDRDWEWRLLETMTTSPSLVIGRSDLTPKSDVAPGITAIAASNALSTVFAATESGSILRWQAVAAADAREENVPKPEFEVVYEGQTRINAITVSPDGRLLAWVDDHGSIVTWDVAKNKQVERRARASRQPGFAIAFAPNSRRLAVGGGKSKMSSHPKNFRSWLISFQVDLLGNLSRIDEQSSNASQQVSSICWLSTDQLMIARGGIRIRTEAIGEVETWRATNRSLELMDSVWKGLNARGLDYHVSTQRAAWCDTVGMFYVYDVKSKRLLCRKRAAPYSLRQVRFAPNGHSLYCVGAATTVSQWQLEPVTRQGPKKGDEASIVEVLAKRAKLLLGHDQSVRDLVYATVPANLVEPHGSSDKRDSLAGLVSVDDDGEARLWLNVEDPNTERIRLQNRRISDARWVDSSRIAVTTFAHAKKQDIVHRERTMPRLGITVEQRHLRQAGPVSVSPECRTTGNAENYVISCRDRLVVLGKGMKEPICVFENDANGSLIFNSAIQLSESNLLACSSPKSTANPHEAHDVTLHLFDIAAKESIETMPISWSSAISDLAFSRDKTTIVGGTVDGKLILFPKLKTQDSGKLSIGEEFKSWRAHRAKINDMVWLGASQRLATVSEDGTCAIWNFTELGPGEFVAELNGSLTPDHRIQVCSGTVSRINASASGDRIVTVGGDRIIRLWDVQTGLELISFQPRNSAVRAIGFSPDEKFLMIAESQHIEVIRLVD